MSMKNNLDPEPSESSPDHDSTKPAKIPNPSTQPETYEAIVQSLQSQLMPMTPEEWNNSSLD